LSLPAAKLDTTLAAAKISAIGSSATQDFVRRMFLYVDAIITGFNMSDIKADARQYSDELSEFHHPKECFLQRADDANAGLMDVLPQYFQSHLSCGAMVRYMFASVHFSPCPFGPILFLDDSIETKPTPLSLMTLVGLRELAGRSLHVTHEPGYLYPGQRLPGNLTPSPQKSRVKPPNDFRKLFEGALTDALRTNPLTKRQVGKNLANNYYTVVVYGNFENNRPFLDLVTSKLQPDRIWAVLGEGAPREEGPKYTQFVRRLTTGFSRCYQWTTGEF